MIKSNKSRIEKDSLGSVFVPEEALWGAQTQRALLNFNISNDLMPLDIIYALTNIKLVAAKTNHKLNVLEGFKKDLIINACKEIIQGNYNNQFPLSVWQSGSGTQTNMNVNEVISNIASLMNGKKLGSHNPLHPNDDVNKSQSTNDAFPSAIQIATINQIKKSLLPEIRLLIQSFNQKSNEWKTIIKIGRTHLQDAVPITLGQEVSAWEKQISVAYDRINHSLEELYALPLGGTAVGTGLNAPKDFDKNVVEELSKLTNNPFRVATNKFSIMASHDGLVNAMSQIKLLAVSLLKIFNDVRFLSCGPRSGLAEIQLPANEPGSSIMPGKINPTQCEAMAMVCTQVIGMDTAISIAGSGGYFQMNAYKPLIGFNIFKSIELLSDACKSCRIFMIEGMKPNMKKIDKYVEQSLMLVTGLAPSIGYEKASEIAHLAHRKDISLREAAINSGYVSMELFDKVVDPLKMTYLNND